MRIDEYNSLSSLLPRYSKVLSRLEQSGVRVANQCRLRTYERRLNQLVVDPQVAVEADLVFAATFDLREIDEIIEHLPVSIDTLTLELLSKTTLALLQETHNMSFILVQSFDAPAFPFAMEHRTSPRVGGEKSFSSKPNGLVHQRGSMTAFALRFTNCVSSRDRALSPYRQTSFCDRQEIFSRLNYTTSLHTRWESLLRSFIIEHSHILWNRLGKEPFAALLWTARLPALIVSTGHSALGTSLLLERDSPDSPEAAFASVAVDAYLKAQNSNHFHAGG